jgi:hypothetical protein
MNHRLSLKPLRLIGCVAVVVNLSVACSTQNSKTSTAETLRAPKIGTKMRLRAKELTQVYVATTEAAYGALAKSAKAKDDYGIMELVLAEQVLIVPHNTEVLILENNSESSRHEITKIRILEGSHLARTGWVPTGWVH